MILKLVTLTKNDLEILKEALTEAHVNGLLGLTDRQEEKLQLKLDAAVLHAEKK